MIDNTQKLDISTDAPLAGMQCYNQPFVNWNGIINYSKDYKQINRSVYGVTNLITEDLISICKGRKHIIIYGHSKSGKVMLARKISEILKCDLIVSDDYMFLGWSDNMYYIKNLLQTEYKEKNVIFEGVQTCRLLRKGVQLNDYFADLVIHITCNYESIVESYYRDGQAYKLKGGKVKRFNELILDKIFFEWHNLQNIHHPDIMPIIINIDTSFVGF